MNLIEQLGGYEKSKDIASKCPSWADTYLEPTKEYVSIFIKVQDGMHLSIDEIKSELLEHRRQHNIFEAGDYVIDEQHTGLLRVTRVMKKRLEVDYLNPQTLSLICHHSILIRHIRHATDLEIAAGHRL